LFTSGGGFSLRILGVHDGHNAAACVFENGELTAAIQEERLRGVKNWSGMPAHAIDMVMRIAGIGFKDLDFIALNGHHMPVAKDRSEILEEYRSTGSLKMTAKKFLRHTFLRTVYQDKRKKERIDALKRFGAPEEKIVFVDHHLCHAAAAYYGQANFDDDVLILTNDGAGDGLCATVNIGRGGKIERIAEVPEAESIGNIYAMVTFLLGMVPLEHEYKLMGMAPYASKAAAKPVYDLFMEMLEFDPRNPLVWRRRPGVPETYFSYEYLKKKLELKRFDLVCAGVQMFCEDMLEQWVRNCVEHTGIKKLALSGGVFMNVKANKQIMEMAEVEDLFVYPSCGDETNAMGAAYQVYTEHADYRTIKPLEHLYLGREFSDAEVLEALEKTNDLEYQKFENIEREIAKLLAEGEVVARFKGRGEFGARALGNRSINGDPARPGVIREINEMIKSRDFWMPFAPSMTEEATRHYLKNPKNIDAPWMIMAFDTNGNPTDIAAALHPYDFTARPQVVPEKTNPDYHRLIREFEAVTGRGVILNTSFNLHGYPIVDSPEDAIFVLENSGLKNLAVGNYLVRKPL
jgi:carbamoyltransferase